MNASAAPRTKTSAATGANRKSVKFSADLPAIGEETADRENMPPNQMADSLDQCSACSFISH